LPTTDASSKPAQPFGHLLVGRILIARGIAKPDQVSACLQQQHAETRINGARRVLGEIVVERGYARHEQIVEALSYQSQQFATLMVGPYRLMAKLGEGGTSVVYRAQAADGARGGARAPEVAIKLLPQQHPGDVAALARFQREVQAGLTLDHPHIVRTLDFGTTRDTNYIVTELMAGGSLAARIEQYGPLNEATALTLLDELLAALGYAWSKGLVHRDIKPSNILFDARGVPKLADLGLASLTREIEVGGERVVGTPHYIAPEQALASPDCDIRADLYSLGATLFYALSGGPPFPETTMVEAINQHLNAAPPAIDHINPAVGPVLAALVRKLMAKRPSDRYADPGEAERDVRLAMLGRATLAEALPAARAHAPLGVQVRASRPAAGDGGSATRLDASRPAAGKPGTTKTLRKRNPGGATATTAHPLATVDAARVVGKPGTDRHQRARIADSAEVRSAARGTARQARARTPWLLIFVLALVLGIGGAGATWMLLQRQHAVAAAAAAHAGPPPPPPAAPVARTSFDLLERIDAHALDAEQWSKRDRVLLSERGAWRYLGVPGALPREYDLSCTFKRLFTGGTLGLVFSVGNQTLSCQIGGSDSRVGFDAVDGKPWESNGTAVDFPERIVPEKRYTVVVRVRDDAVSVLHEGATLCRLPRAGRTLGVESRWALPAGAGVGVGAVLGQIAVYGLTLTEYARPVAPPAH
jgi:hypothetical protein